MASNRSRFEQLLDKYEEPIRAAFIAAYNEIRSRIVLKRLVEQLERGDVAGAIELLGIETTSFGALEMALVEAFNGSGIAFASEIKLRSPEGNRVAIQFGIRNPEAEALLRNYSAEFVTRETAATKELIRVSLTEGLARGDNPTRTALDMVGRVSDVTKKREGGVIGLSGPQERTQAKARQALLSGDVEGMRDYLQLKQRDRRTDRAIIKAIEAGKPIAREDVDRIIGRLNDRQLKYRADKIALHETFTALSMSKNESIRQVVESGKVDIQDVTCTWRHTSQENPRTQHVVMQGQKVPFGQPFVAPDGTLIPYPHAPGVPLRHTAGCKCVVAYEIDYTAALIRRRALV